MKLPANKLQRVPALNFDIPEKRTGRAKLVPFDLLPQLNSLAHNRRGRVNGDLEAADHATRSHRMIDGDVALWDEEHAVPDRDVFVDVHVGACAVDVPYDV